MQLVFTRAVAGKPAQDVAVTKIAFRATSGAILDWNATVNNADMTGVESAFDTFIGLNKSDMHNSYTLTQYRWYELKTPTAPVGDPMRVNDKSTPIVGTASSSLPPQCAINLTLETDERRHWGRMCMPFTASTTAASDGRVAQARVDAIRNNFLSCLNSCVSAHMHPIVYSRPSGSQYEVKRIRVDDTYDIIRRRRYEGVPYRALGTLS